MGAVCWAVYHPEHVMASLVRFLVWQLKPQLQCHTAWAADVLAPYPFEKWQLGVPAVRRGLDAKRKEEEKYDLSRPCPERSAGRLLSDLWPWGLEPNRRVPKLCLGYPNFLLLYIVLLVLLLILLSLFILSSRLLHVT